MNLIKETNKLISEKSEIRSLKVEEGYEEIRSDIQTLLKNQKDMRVGFVWLATQNYKLFRLNQKLSDQLEKLEEECDRLKKEREVKKNRKEARANRKRLPKREPMTHDLYNLLIQSAIGPLR
jgi:peptidoglycan hydrolase CwlO-like protein